MSILSKEASSRVRRVLDVAYYALAGAMGGMLLFNTLESIFGAIPGEWVMVCAGALALGLVSQPSAFKRLSCTFHRSRHV